MATAAETMALPTDHSNRAPGFIACSVITSTAALALVSLRTYVRLAIVRKFGIDDYTIHLAMANQPPPSTALAKCQLITLNRFAASLPFA